MCCSGGERFIVTWGGMISHVWIKCATFVIDNIGFTIALINLLWLLLLGWVCINIELLLRRSLRDYLFELKVND